MEKNDKQPKGFSEVLDFMKNTKDGKFTKGGASVTELLKCTISREEVTYIQNENVQHNEVILYGLS